MLNRILRLKIIQFWHKTFLVLLFMWVFSCSLSEPFKKVDIQYNIINSATKIYLGMSLKEIQNLYPNILDRNEISAYEEYYISFDTIIYNNQKVKSVSRFYFQHDQLVELTVWFFGDTTIANTYFEKSRYVNHNHRILNGYIYKDSIIYIHGQHSSSNNGSFLRWIYKAYSSNYGNLWNIE